MSDSHYKPKKTKITRELFRLYPLLELFIDSEGKGGAISPTRPSSIGYAADQARMQIEKLRRDIAWMERWLACRKHDKVDVK